MRSFMDAVISLVIAASAYALFFTLPFMYLWNNALVGTIDGVHEITFLRALGIMVMIGLLVYKPDLSKREE